MNIPAFQAKWQGVTLKERSASQEHFLGLCRHFGVDTPVEAISTGTFPIVGKSGGGKGFAWMTRVNPPTLTPVTSSSI